MNSCVRLAWVSDLLPPEFLKRKRATPRMKVPSPLYKALGHIVEEGEVAEAQIILQVMVSVFILWSRYRNFCVCNRCSLFFVLF